MSAVVVDIAGSRELQEVLTKLGEDIAGKVAKDVCREAGEVILDKVNARHRSKRLRRTLRVTVWQGNRGRTSANVYFPERDKLGIDPKDRNYWPAAYEYGYERRLGYSVKDEKVVERVVKVPPQNFMRGGFDEAEPIIADNMERLIGEHCEAAWEKHGA